MALASNDSITWKEAMDDEYDSLIENRTWELVNLPLNRNLVDNKWVYKMKQTSTGGFFQVYGVDYFQAYSPVMRYTSIRTIMAMVATDNLKLSQFHVKTSFLYGDSSEATSWLRGWHVQSLFTSQEFIGTKNLPNSWNRIISRRAQQIHVYLLAMERGE